jgi:hypothetical protein
VAPQQSEAAGFDAAQLAGALADDDRLQCFAAVRLGASTMEDVATATGLSVTRASKALGRLVDVGVAQSSANGLTINAAGIQQAARKALQRVRSDEHDDAPDDHRKVLQVFVKEGRLTGIPTSARKRAVLLDWLAQDFEPGKQYTEAMVNLKLGRRHADTAAWRRYLVDGEFLSRESGIYWRSGGTVSE